MRREYEMTQEQEAALLDSMRPTPAIALQCGMSPGVQLSANEAWCRLGKIMGFDGMTVEPARFKSQRFFTAEPTTCKGKNCGVIQGEKHSPECIAEHEACCPQTQG